MIRRVPNGFVRESCKNYTGIKHVIDGRIEREMKVIVMDLKNRAIINTEA